jgi:biotin carboxylase
LGGSAFQTPAIVHALRCGHRVITCDYLPDNPGHRYAHEYHNISTTDHAAVLSLACERSVDGILAYASDPAAWTAAFVAEQMGLPGASPGAIEILSNKALFRAYLRENGFNAPGFGSATALEEACELAVSLGFPVMVKPCDSSGSKGVSRVDSVSQMPDAFHSAQSYSRSGGIIVEQWIAREGRQIAGDGLVIDERLVFGCFGDEHFNTECCAHAPVGESFPGQLSRDHREKLFENLQRLMSLLKICNLVFNLDAIIDRNSDVMIIEIGPRAGGNFLPQLIHRHTGVDLTDIAIRIALGIHVPTEAYASRPAGFHASWMIHSRTAGMLSGLRIAPDLGPNVFEFGILSKLGAKVNRFTSARDTLGYALLEFDEEHEMERCLAAMASLLQPIVE